MSNFLDNIKLIASELANMSPKTQLEIVKLCKNLCLNVKDYLVELDETTLVNITTRLDNLQDELTTAEGNIQANANAIDTINDTIDLINNALNDRYTKFEIDALLSNKINKQIIELTGGSGTLTLAQLTNIINGQNIMLKRDNVIYIKSFENDTITIFERPNFTRSWVNGIITTVREEIRITKSTGDWVYNAVTDIRTYDTDKIDELIAGAGGKYYLHKVVCNCANSLVFATSFINSVSEEYTFANKSVFYEELLRQFGPNTTTGWSNYGNFVDVNNNNTIMKFLTSINQSSNNLNFSVVENGSQTSKTYILTNIRDVVVEL